jgi:hypothetical protein
MKFRFPTTYKAIALFSGDMKRFTALAFTGVMMLAGLLGSFHHHDDVLTHSDCSICAVAHHQTACVAGTATYTPPQRSFVSTNFLPYSLRFHSTAIITGNSRAPPA